MKQDSGPTVYELCTSRVELHYFYVLNLTPPPPWREASFVILSKKVRSFIPISKSSFWSHSGVLLSILFKVQIVLYLLLIPRLTHLSVLR